MKILSSISLGVALLFASFAPAAATTVSSGEVYCESANRIPSAEQSSCTYLEGDFSNSAGSPTGPITILSDATILGFVEDSGSNPGNFQDFATIVLTTTSFITFELFNADQGFDALVGLNTVGDPNPGFSPAVPGGLLSDTFGPGTYLFSVDATKPTNSQTTVGSNYRVTIAPVPLPASGLLILGGLGALGALRRRKARA